MKREERKAYKLKLLVNQQKVQEVVKTGICPLCKAGLVRNLSLTGWWQCEQLGVEGFRKDSKKPSCSWQGFTE